MKTTLDIEDGLLIEAKAVAARRRTSLKALVEDALRREVFPASRAEVDPAHDDLVEVGPHGYLVLKSRGKQITSEEVYKMMEEEGI